jgi:hypothetical protein
MESNFWSSWILDCNNVFTNFDLRIMNSYHSTTDPIKTPLFYKYIRRLWGFSLPYNHRISIYVKMHSNNSKIISQVPIPYKTGVKCTTIPIRYFTMAVEFQLRCKLGFLLNEICRSGHFAENCQWTFRGLKFQTWCKQA